MLFLMRSPCSLNATGRGTCGSRHRQKRHHSRTPSRAASSLPPAVQASMKQAVRQWQQGAVRVRLRPGGTVSLPCVWSLHSWSPSCYRRRSAKGGHGGLPLLWACLTSSFLDFCWRMTMPASTFLLSRQIEHGFDTCLLRIKKGLPPLEAGTSRLKGKLDRRTLETEALLVGLNRGAQGRERMHPRNNKGIGNGLGCANLEVQDRDSKLHASH